MWWLKYEEGGIATKMVLSFKSVELRSMTDAVTLQLNPVYKISLTSLTKAFPSHNLSTVLFGECDSLALYFTSTHSLFYTIMCNHTNTCTLAHALTHSTFSQTGRVSDIPGVVEGWSGKQWTKPGLKLESCCHMKMTSFLNWGKPWWILWNTIQWQGTPMSLSCMIIIS